LIIILGSGNAVSEPMLNLTETSILHGYAVIIVAIAMFKIYDYLTTKYRRFSKMIVAKPILLLENGKILNKALLKARISREEFLSYLRLNGTDDVSEIKSSYLEINGQVSFIKKKKQEEEKIHTQ
jgi:uncharacterized membrane protein YcaP (DUF421 family)